MKQVLLFTLLSTMAFANVRAQTTTEDYAAMQKEATASKSKFGIKLGYNVAKITGSTPNYSPDKKNGFMVAAFYSPTTKSGLGYRSELVFSRQGFGFGENGKTTSVTNDYLYLPQFTTLGITKFLQLQVGGQIGYLLKSSKEASDNKTQDITSFANRLDYGAAAGVEIYPVKGLILGGRYNFSLGSAYKQPPATTMSLPIPNPLPFNPSEVKGKNAVINFFIGYRF